MQFELHIFLSTQGIPWKKDRLDWILEHNLRPPENRFNTSVTSTIAPNSSPVNSSCNSTTTSRCIWIGANKERSSEIRFTLVVAIAKTNRTHWVEVASWIGVPKGVSYSRAEASIIPDECEFCGEVDPKVSVVAGLISHSVVRGVF